MVKVESSDSSKDPSNWGGGVRSDFPEFPGQWMFKEIHITL